MELLGSPIGDLLNFFDLFLSAKLDKTASIQEKLADLGDPQVELGTFSVLVKSLAFYVVCLLPP